MNSYSRRKVVDFILMFLFCLWLISAYVNTFHFGQNEGRDELFEISEKDSSRLEIRPAVLDDLYQFGNIMDNTSGGCSKLAEVGGAWNCQLYDGVKDVCFDRWFHPPANSCTIYSFGAGLEITFEYAILDVWNCQIYVHDFSVDYSKEINDSRIIFKKRGIANSTFTSDTGDQFVTYRDALASNGHNESSDIHYLKIDIEGHEFEALPDMISQGLLKNVWQLHMEVHNFREKKDSHEWLRTMNRDYEIIGKLEDSGFQRVRTLQNTYTGKNPREPNCCRDILWINKSKIPNII